MTEILPSRFFNFGPRVLFVLLIFHCTGATEKSETPLQTIEVNVGERTELLCEGGTITGDTTVINSTWLKKQGSNYAPVKTSQRVKEVKITGGNADGIELYIRGVIKSDGGRYKCILKTKTKQATSYVDLVVKSDDTGK